MTESAIIIFALMKRADFATESLAFYKIFFYLVSNPWFLYWLPPSRTSLVVYYTCYLIKPFSNNL